MNKQLCFIIENNKLYLEKILVSFNDTPIFFICIDDKNNRYLVLCSDLDKLEYIVEKQSLKNLWHMLTQKVTMRAALLKCTHFWQIESGNSIAEDTVEKKGVNEIDFSVLPVENALYEKITVEDSAYVEQVTSEYFKESYFDEFKSIKDFDGTLGNVEFSHGGVLFNAENSVNASVKLFEATMNQAEYNERKLPSYQELIDDKEIKTLYSNSLDNGHGIVSEYMNEIAA